jgi:hypothetical protein
MTTCWFKPAFTREDRDPETGELRPDAMRPGIYCKDEATYDELRLASIGKGVTVQYHFDGDVSIGGMRVYVATPEQAEVLERGQAVDPAAYESGQLAVAAAAAAEFARLMGRVGGEPPSDFDRPKDIAPGTNRAQRRADAAAKRRRA